MLPSMIRRALGNGIVALGRELAAWKPSSERASFGLETVISVLLSVALAHALRLPDAWWAAISGFAVMQTRFAASLERACYRVLGTIVGAALGAMAGLLVSAAPWLFVPLPGLIGAIAVYRANAGSASYGWVLGGVTAIMVVYEAHQVSSFEPMVTFAALRVVDVCLGVFACVSVAGVFHVCVQHYRRFRPGRASALYTGTASEATPMSWSPQRRSRAALAVQAGIAVEVVALLAYFLKFPGLAQALVTVIAVLVLPPEKVDRSHQPVAEKMAHRMTGCLIAGVLGLALLPLVRGQEMPYLIALAAGVWVGCHVQSGNAGASYIGRQFSVAFLMIFVQDSVWTMEPRAAMVRFSGIVLGIVVLWCAIRLTSEISFFAPPQEVSR